MLSRPLPVAAVTINAGDEGGDERQVAQGVERLGPDGRVGPLTIGVNCFEPVDCHAGLEGRRLLHLTYTAGTKTTALE